jgi:hypothetical protein
MALFCRKEHMPCGSLPRLDRRVTNPFTRVSFTLRFFALLISLRLCLYFFFNLIHSAAVHALYYLLFPYIFCATNFILATRHAEMLRIPHYLDNRLTDGGKVVRPTHQLLSTPQKHHFSASFTNFC